MAPLLEEREEALAELRSRPHRSIVGGARRVWPAHAIAHRGTSAAAEFWTTFDELGAGVSANAQLEPCKRGS